jgi:hypothetical protein
VSSISERTAESYSYFLVPQVVIASRRRRRRLRHPPQRSPTIAVGKQWNISLPVMLRVTAAATRNIGKESLLMIYVREKKEQKYACSLNLTFYRDWEVSRKRGNYSVFGCLKSHNLSCLIVQLIARHDVYLVAPGHKQEKTDESTV